MGREAANSAIRSAVAERAAANPWPDWWAGQVEPMLYSLPKDDSLVGHRQQLIDEFTACMAVVGMDRFDAAGLAANWWTESVHELKTALNRGWKAVIKAWLTTAKASQDVNNALDLADQTAIKLLAGEQLNERATLAAEHARRDAEIKAAEAVDDDCDDEVPTTAEIKDMKSARANIKRKLKAIDAALLTEAREALNATTEADAPDLAIGVLRDRFAQQMTDHFAAIERRTLGWFDDLVNKYGTTLGELKTERDTAAARLQHHLKELGYG